MKYNCKYPNKLNMEGYCNNILEEYKHVAQYSDLLEHEMENFVWFILIKISSIIEHPKSDLNKVTNYLLKIDALSREEYMAIPSNEIEKSLFNVLFLAKHKPITIVGLIANNMNFQLREGKQDQYEKFLENITIRCIKEIVAINQLKLNEPKKVTFGDDDKVKAKIIKFEERRISSPQIAASYQKPQMLHVFEHLKKEKKREREAIIQREEVAKEKVSPAKKFTITHN